jgi:hypothetical protein
MEVRATEEGESEGCSVVGRIPDCVRKAGNMAGLRKQADFLLVFHTRELEQPGLRDKADDDSENCWCGLAHKNARRHQASIVQVRFRMRNCRRVFYEAFERLELCELETLTHSS